LPGNKQAFLSLIIIYIPQISQIFDFPHESYCRIQVSFPLYAPCLIEYSGGLELVFDKQKTLQIEVPSDKKDFNIQDLIVLLRDNYLKGKPEFFVGGDVL